MSSATEQVSPKTHIFVVWAPDYADEGAFDRRMAIRDQHLQDLKKNQENGFITKIAGPLISPESLEAGASIKMNGSMLLVRGTSMEEVRAKVEKDVFWINNVWDKEKLVISPILIAADI